MRTAPAAKELRNNAARNNPLHGNANGRDAAPTLAQRIAIEVRPVIACPVAAYRDYMDAIVQRDVERVLARLTPEAAAPLVAARSHGDFSVFFELWCCNQIRAEPVRPLAADPFSSTVLLRCGAERWVAELQRIAGEWRVRCDRPITGVSAWERAPG